MNRNASETAVRLILLCFLGLGFAYSVINPLHEATDELRHYRFVQHIIQRHYLPIQGELACSAQGHHPPLFYVLGAALTAWIPTGHDVCYSPPANPFWDYRYWEVGVDNKNQYLHGDDEAFPWHGEALAAHLIRALNVCLGAATVWLTWLTGQAIWPRRPGLALGAVALVAFNPMFLYMSGAINNDVIAALSGTAVALACVRLLNDEKGLSRRWGVILGVLFGLALMSKFNLSALAVLIETAVTLVAWRKKQMRLWLEANLLIAFFTLLLAGWWFVRNQWLYGEPTGLKVLTELWGVRDPADSFPLAVSELPYAWTSLWGRFGYGQIPLPQWVYDGLAYGCVFALSGLFLPIWRRDRQAWRETGGPLLLMALNVALFFAVLFNYLLVSPAGPMGRFFFPALPSLAILLFYGLSEWGRLLSVRPKWTAVALHAVLFTLATVALLFYLAPAYARPARFTILPPQVAPLHAQFDSFVSLRGAFIHQSSVRPGEPIDVDLYWEVNGRPPGNYLLFVHLGDETGQLVAQRDTHPGLGNFPSSLWRPGDQFIDTIRLYVPETAYTPAKLDLSIGLYAPEGYRLALTGFGPHGAIEGDTLALGSLSLDTWHTVELDGDQFPNPLAINFNNQWQLMGYTYNQRQLANGEPLTVTLYWQAKSPSSAYQVEVQLQNEAGEAVAQVEEALPHGTTGQVVITSHTIDTATLAEGSYHVRVALLDELDKEYQNRVALDGHIVDNQALLARLQIQP